MKDTKIQWHPGFVAAMNLELREDRENLTFHKEHNLNTNVKADFQCKMENTGKKYCIFQDAA